MGSKQYKYQVWIRSVPGFYAQYSGKVDVIATGEENAKDRAVTQLKLTSFPDRTKDMWKIDKVIKVG